MSEISLMPSIGISATALDAETRRMEVIANNVANAQTTHDANGKVFRRKLVVFAAKLEQSMNRHNRAWCSPRECRRQIASRHPD